MTEIRMTFQEFEELLKKMQAEEFEVGQKKGHEYALQSRLDNFHRIGAEVMSKCPKCGTLHPIGPMVALWVYLKKQLDAVLQFINRGMTLSEETIDHRILDSRVYLSLLQGLVEEVRAIKRIESLPPLKPKPIVDGPLIPDPNFPNFKEEK